MKKKKNRVNSLKGIINIVIEHQGNASFVQMYLVEFYPNTCIRRMINGDKNQVRGTREEIKEIEAHKR